MNYRDFAYFLTVTNITPSELAAVSELLKKDDYFNGLLRNYGSLDSAPFIFDADAVGGSVTEIDRDRVEAAMHKLALSFPDSTFYLQAEDVDDKSVAYEIQTHGDLFQSADLRSHMPPLSSPVPFENRHLQAPVQDFAEQILSRTDFSLLHAQKTSLVNAIYNKEAIPKEVLEGLVNFLDLIEDWAEQEGRFTFPELPESQKPSLADQIKSASSRSQSTAPNQESKEHMSVSPKSPSR